MSTHDNDTPIVNNNVPLSDVGRPHVVEEPYYVPHHTPTDNPSDNNGYACAFAEIDAERTVEANLDERTALTQEMKDKYEMLDAIVTLYKHEMFGKEELVKLIDEKL